MKETPTQVANHATFLSVLDAAKIAMHEDSIKFYEGMIRQKREQIKEIKARYQNKN